MLLHGVVAADREEALVAHVQLDESAHNRGVTVRVPGLDPEATTRCAWEGPVARAAVEHVRAAAGDRARPPGGR